MLHKAISLTCVTLCSASLLVFAPQGWLSLSLGVGAGMHVTLLLLYALDWFYFGRNRPPTDPTADPVPEPAQSAPKPKRNNFVPPKDGVVEIAVPNGSDIAAAVLRFAADLGMEAYQSATAGFLLRDGKRQKVYRTRIQRIAV